MHRNGLTREWITGFSEVSPVRSGRDHTGKFKRQSAGRLGSPAGPAVSSSTGWVMGQCKSETQLTARSLYLVIHWYTLILLCISRLLMMHFLTLFLTGVHFNIWKIMCQTHASAVGLLSVYLGEKFTHSLMSQSLRALRRSFMWELLLCFAFWSHGIITNDDYTALLPKHGQRGSRNSVYERKVYKYSTGKVYVQDVPSQNPMPFCSQWQPQWF